MVDQDGVFARDDYSEKRKKSRKRARTSEDKISINAEKHPLLSPCNCDMKCIEVINAEGKSMMSFGAYLVKYKLLGLLLLLILQHQNAVGRIPSVKYQITKIYHFIDENTEKRRVCCKFYLRTLGFSHDTFVKKLFNSRCKDTKGKVLPSPDKRGGST